MLYVNDISINVEGKKKDSVQAMWPHNVNSSEVFARVTLQESLELVLAVLLHGFPGGSVRKESACNAGGLGSIPGLGRSPGGGHGSLLQYSCLENLNGQRSLAGYSPWGRKELDMTEWLSRAQYSLKSHCCLPGVSVSFSKFILCLKNKNKNWKQCKVLK